MLCALVRKQLEILTDPYVLKTKFFFPLVSETDKQAVPKKEDSSVRTTSQLTGIHTTLESFPINT